MTACLSVAGCDRLYFPFDPAIRKEMWIDNTK
jgi:hypothetical protein